MKTIWVFFSYEISTVGTEIGRNLSRLDTTPGGPCAPTQTLLFLNLSGRNYTLTPEESDYADMYFGGDPQYALPIFTATLGPHPHGINAVFIGQDFTWDEMSRLDNWLFIELTRTGRTTANIIPPNLINTNQIYICLPHDLRDWGFPGRSITVSEHFTLLFERDAGGNWINRATEVAVRLRGGGYQRYPNYDPTRQRYFRTTDTGRDYVRRRPW